MSRIRVMVYEPAADGLRQGGEELLGVQPAEGGWLWADFEATSPERERELMQSHFSLARLALQDAQRDRHPPKLEFFEDYLFLLLRDLDPAGDPADMSAVAQIALFVGRNYLVTRRARPSASVDQAWIDAAEGRVPLSEGPMHIAYRVCRLVSDAYTPVVLGLEEKLGDLEDEMFERPRDAILESLSDYNRALKKLRRNLTYQYGMMEQIARGEVALPFRVNRHEFNDVYEQMERLASLCQLNQELAVDLMNTYLSLSSHRLNQIMRVLTIVTVIFVPLGLLAGIYGMNFEFMPELRWRYGYFVVLAVMISVPATLIFVFKRLKWL